MGTVESSPERSRPARLPRPVLTLAALLAAGAGGAPLLGAQACRPATDVRARFLVNSVVHLVTSTDPNVVRERIEERLPAARATDVEYVTDERLCRRAARAHAADIKSPPPVGSPGRVYVVRVGDRYVVLDPAFTVGEWVRSSVMSTRYQVLSRALR